MTECWQNRLFVRLRQRRLRRQLARREKLMQIIAKPMPEPYLSEAKRRYRCSPELLNSLRQSRRRGYWLDEDRLTDIKAKRQDQSDVILGQC